MPIYEYECGGCRRRVSLLVLTPSKAADPRCPRCDSAELTRLMSRFATVKSEDARLDSLSDPSTYGDINENDPASMARFMKRMGDEMGEDLGDDVDAAMDEAMAEGDEHAGDGAAGGVDDSGGEFGEPQPKARQADMENGDTL